MEINRVDPLYPHRPRMASSRPPAPSEDGPRDRVSISPQARLRAQLGAQPDIRTDRVDAIRKAIQAGTYDESRLLSQAVDRLLDELNG